VAEAPTTVYLGGGISAEEEKVLLDSSKATLDLKIQSCGDLIRKLKQASKVLKGFCQLKFTYLGL
jgi:hypothetical protein